MFYCGCRKHSRTDPHFPSFRPQRLLQQLLKTFKMHFPSWACWCTLVIPELRGNHGDCIHYSAPWQDPVSKTKGKGNSRVHSMHFPPIGGSCIPCLWKITTFYCTNTSDCRALQTGLWRRGMTRHYYQLLRNFPLSFNTFLITLMSSFN